MIIAAFAELPMAGQALAASRAVTVATRNLAPFVMTNDNGKSGFTVELADQQTTGSVRQEGRYRNGNHLGEIPRGNGYASDGAAHHR